MTVELTASLPIIFSPLASKGSSILGLRIQRNSRCFPTFLLIFVMYFSFTTAGSELIIESVICQLSLSNNKVKLAILCF